MLQILWLVFIISTTVNSQYVDTYTPIIKQRIFNDAFLTDILSRLNNDHSDSMMSYFDLDSDIPKDLDVVLRSSDHHVPDDYEHYPSIYEQAAAANPTSRDQEYLQHSSLWGHQFMPSDYGINEDTKMLRPKIPTDTSLPAYCNPPNPCPYGYGENHGCIMDFDNTAFYSREYQAAQNCICDNEHMFDCAGHEINSEGSDGGERTGSNSEMTSTMEKFLLHEFQSNNGLDNSHSSKGVVKKLYKTNQPHMNPFFNGDKLPIAAKKGIHIKI